MLLIYIWKHLMVVKIPVLFDGKIDLVIIGQEDI
jgi:hypothetical protein